jgi:hypothetical protein
VAGETATRRRFAGFSFGFDGGRVQSAMAKSGGGVLKAYDNASVIAELKN